MLVIRVAEWEAEIKLRRNGRLVEVAKALGGDPASALYFAHNDINLWARRHPESVEHESQDVR